MAESVVTKNIIGYLDAHPVGSIIAWHRDFLGFNAPLELPAGWVECNGQTLNDPESLLNGQVIPNLNGDPAGNNAFNFKAQFLRGGLKSGVSQNDALQKHTHNERDAAGHRHIDLGHDHQIPTIDPLYKPYTVIDGFSLVRGGPAAASPLTVQRGASAINNTFIDLGDPVNSKTTGAQPVKIDDETRPANMSIVWIMKVKHTAHVTADSIVKSDTNAPEGSIYVGKTGNVGLGTSTPKVKLDVNGDILVRGQVNNPLLQGYREKTINIGNVSGVVQIDLSVGNIFIITLTADSSFSFINFSLPYNMACSYTFILRNFAQKNLIWPTGILWSDGKLPRIDNEAVVSLLIMDMGQKWYGFSGGYNFKPFL